jgi:hypothetical protein
VVVPDLIGFEVSEAQRLCESAHLVLLGPDADGPPLRSLTFIDRWVVTSQQPEAGALVDREDAVTIEFRRFGGGDDSGDREPREPPPILDITYISQVAPDAPEGDPGDAVPARP